MPRITEDITGNRYGRLLVLRRDGLLNKQAAWRCRCDCGTEKTISGSSMRNGRVASCGCWAKQTAHLKAYKHGHKAGGRRSTTYICWCNMLARCTNPKNRGYKDYGGRGIQVYKPWYDFQNFLKDMGEQPPGMTIERVNNNEGYSPRNCEWATPKQQGQNKRNNVVHI